MLTKQNQHHESRMMINTKKLQTFATSVQQLPIDNRNHTLELEALKGNDPHINVDQYSGVGKGDFVFIGPSFLRSLLLCLQIATNEVNPDVIIPRLMIIDRNHFIISCWQALKNNLTQILSGDFSSIYTLVKSQLKEYPKINSAYLEHPDDVLFGLIKRDLIQIVHDLRKFNFNLIQSAVRNSVVLCADWSDSSLFSKVRKLLDETGLLNRILYPSNIIECTFEEPDEQRIILENIQLLSPILSIHTLANYTREDVKSGHDYHNPSQYLMINGSAVSSDKILEHINLFSITRAHQRVMPFPKKMQPRDTILGSVSRQTIMSVASATCTFFNCYGQGCNPPEGSTVDAEGRTVLRPM